MNLVDSSSPIYLVIFFLIIGVILSLKYKKAPIIFTSTICLICLIYGVAMLYFSYKTSSPDFQQEIVFSNSHFKKMNYAEQQKIKREFINLSKESRRSGILWTLLSLFLIPLLPLLFNYYRDRKEKEDRIKTLEDRIQKFEDGEK